MVVHPHVCVGVGEGGFKWLFFHFVPINLNAGFCVRVGVKMNDRWRWFSLAQMGCTFLHMPHLAQNHTYGYQLTLFAAATKTM